METVAAPTPAEPRGDDAAVTRGRRPFAGRSPRDYLALLAAVMIGTGIPWLLAAWLRGHSHFVPEVTWLILLLLGCALFIYVRWPRQNVQQWRRSHDERRLKRRLITMAVVFYVLLAGTIGLILLYTSTQSRTFLHIAVLAVLVLLLLFVHGRTLARRIKVPWTRPVAVRLTGFGWLYGCFAVGLGFVALNSGLNLLFVLFGILASYALVSWVLSALNFRKLSITRELPEVLIANRPAAVQARVSNRKRWLASYSLWLEEGWPLELAPPQEQAVPSAYALAIAPGQLGEVRYTVEMPRRGRVRFPGFTLASRFPFGLFTRYRYVQAAQEVLVWPEPAPIPEALRRGAPLSLASPQAGPSHGRGHAEVCGVREYVPGADDVRAIHWPTSARLARPIVRERERESAAARVIVLERGPQGEAFENRISLAAALVEDALQARAAVTLAIAPQGPLAPPVAHAGQRHRCLNALAELVGYAPGAQGERARREDEARMQQQVQAAHKWNLPAGCWLIALPRGEASPLATWIAALAPQGSSLVNSP